ncbi:MAG: DUF4623 domain-containing protein, partial [Ignavibacteriaceae bacterium]|nr:DUF4623 domain-containing protein [Ignavibacteriaceae bacterium]
MRNKLTFSVSAIMLVLFLLLGSTQTQAQYRTSVWEKSAKLTNKPLWLGTDTERGSAFGNNKLYVVSRKWVTANVYTVDANTGDSTGYLNVTGVTGGTFALSDVEVADDGAIYAANVTTNALTSAFKIYRWANDAAAPVEVINFTGSPQRLGDKFTVVGSAANNSLTIYAAAATGTSGVPYNVVYRWTTADFGATFVQDSIVLTGVSTTAPGATPAVYPLTTGLSEFAWKANGTPLRRFNADGSVIDSVNTNVLPTGSNALTYFTQGGKKYILIYQYTGTPTQNGLRLIDVTNQYNTQHLVLDYTPSLGTTTNANGTGDVDLVSNGDGTYDAYVFASNNGLAKYKYYFNGLPDVTTVSSFPYTVDFANGLITDGGWSGNFVDRGTESKTNFAARFLWNTTPAAQTGITFGYLTSPKIQLPANHRVKFWWKDDDITAVVGQDTTYFEVSTDNGVSWSTLGFLSRASSMTAYEEAIFDLSAYAGNSFRMRWRDRTNGLGAAYGFGLDDILIEALPMVPVMALNPTSTAFGSTYIGGNMQKTVVVSNNGGAALTGTLTLPAGITANTTSLNVPNGQSFNLLLTWTPTTPGAYSDSIRFVTNDATASDFYYKLTGTAVTPFILNEVVQNFDTSTGTIPANWTGNYTVNSVGGIGWSKRLTR